jgi:hypothetical protein
MPSLYSGAAFFNVDRAVSERVFPPFGLAPHRQGKRRSGALVVLRLLATFGLPLALLAGCVPGAREVDDVRDLSRALRAAGASVGPTEALAASHFGAPGEVWQVNQALVQVLEFESLEARQIVSGGISPDGLRLGQEPLAWSDRPNVWAVGRLIVVYAGTDGGTILLLSGLLGDPLTEPATAVDEPYPPAVTAAIRALAEALWIQPGTIGVSGFERVEWPDACLGLPDPEEVCAAVITPGWRVLLRAQGGVYEAHCDDLGQQVRLRPAP